MLKSSKSICTLGAFAILPCVGIATANPIVDGSLDSIYGGPSVLQNTQTNFGDNSDGDIGLANGSELDMGDAMIRDGGLYIMLAGTSSRTSTRSRCSSTRVKVVRTCCETTIPTSTSMG